MKQSVQPERLCVGCRRLRPKSELIRIVRSSEGEISIDTTSKGPGRGAYLCRSLECLREARRHNGFSWALKGRVDPALYDRIEEALRVSEEDES